MAPRPKTRLLRPLRCRRLVACRWASTRKANRQLQRFLRTCFVAVLVSGMCCSDRGHDNSFRIIVMSTNNYNSQKLPGRMATSYTQITHNDTNSHLRNMKEHVPRAGLPHACYLECPKSLSQRMDVSRVRACPNSFEAHVPRAVLSHTV